MLSSITRFLRDEEGATAIEYGLIAGLVAIGITLTLTNLGTALRTLFALIATKLTAATATTT